LLGTVRLFVVAHVWLVGGLPPRLWFCRRVGL
jgi:hypothetical protein